MTTENQKTEIDLKNDRDVKSEPPDVGQVRLSINNTYSKKEEDKSNKPPGEFKSYRR